MKYTAKETSARIARVNAILTAEYLSDLETVEKEKAAIKEMEASSQKCCMLLTGENNAAVVLGSMKDCITAMRYLKAHEEDIDEWILAGINGMIDKISEDGSVPFDLPYVIVKMLTYAD